MPSRGFAHSPGDVESNSRSKGRRDDRRGDCESQSGAGQESPAGVSSCERPTLGMAAATMVVASVAGAAKRKRAEAREPRATRLGLQRRGPTGAPTWGSRGPRPNGGRDGSPLGFNPLDLTVRGV